MLMLCDRLASVGASRTSEPLKVTEAATKTEIHARREGAEGPRGLQARRSRAASADGAQVLLYLII